MRSKIFVPGSRPELFEKARRSAADAISFDLEDAVVAERKEEARRLVGTQIAARPSSNPQTTIVRVNKVGGRLFEADLDAVVRPGLDVINLPKIEDADEIRLVADRLERLEKERGIETSVGILVNIETPRGLRNAAVLAGASERVAGLQLGFGDLFEPLGIERTAATLLNVRLACRLAAAEADVPAYDGAFVRRRTTWRGSGPRRRPRGHSALPGRAASILRRSLSPMPCLRRRRPRSNRARRVVAAADEMEPRGVGAFTVDGVMADGPFIARAREILRVAGRARAMFEGRVLLVPGHRTAVPSKGSASSTARHCSPGR